MSNRNRRAALSMWVAVAAAGCGARPLGPVDSIDAATDATTDGGAPTTDGSWTGDAGTGPCLITEPPTGRFTYLSAGNDFTCGIHTDGNLTCWGYSYFNEPTFTATYKDVSADVGLCDVESGGTLHCWGLPASVGDPPTGAFDQVVAGEDAMCARAGSRVTCVGHAGYAPPQLQFESLTGGAYYMCGLTTTQSVVCWEPRVGIDTQLVQTGPYVAVDTGRFFACGLGDGDRGVDCWQTDKTAPAATILGQAPPAGPFTELSTGEFHACALRDDGIVVCWGEDRYGQATPPGGLRLAHVSAGTSHTCGIMLDGMVICWGGGAECGL